jgi:hypothetical protein
VLLRYHMKFRFWFQEYTPAAPVAAPVAVPVAMPVAMPVSPTPVTPAGLTKPPRPSHYHLQRYYYLTERDAGECNV